ncbi:MAG: outer membrane lipoprotein-sorting protein [Thermodesulfobacteriota bacterium]
MRIKSFILVLILCLAAPLSAKPQEPLKLDQVLAKYYEAIGGLEKWNNLNTMVMQGTMKSQGVTIPITAYHERPYKCRIEFKVQGTTMAQIYGGYFAWQINPLSGNPEPAPMSSGKTRYMKDTCGIESSLKDYKKKRHKVKLLGEEEIDGKNAYKINLKYNSGNIETFYIDAKTFLLLRTVGLYNMDGSDLRTTTDFKQYKNIDGYVVPNNLVIQIHGNPEPEVINVSKFEFNTDIDSTIFDFPKENMEKMQQQLKEMK